MTGKLAKKCLLSLIFLTTINACKKDNTSPSSPSPNRFGEIFQISFKLDTTTTSKAYPIDSINDIGGYTWDQGNGYYYFGGGPIYRWFNHWIEFQLGAAYGPITSNRDSALTSFFNLCSPGNKIYDGIRYAGQKQTNRVEITYVDENGDIWSTVKIDASDPRNPKLAPTPIQQTGSTFVITDEKEVSFINNSKNSSVLIKETFNCILYKYTTYEQKRVTNGSFVAVFGVI